MTTSTTKLAVLPKTLSTPQFAYDASGNVQGIAGPDGLISLDGATGAVASVNGKTGPVELTAEDVGAVPVPYRVGAVHFDGPNSSIVNAALNCVDSGDVSFAFWCKQPQTQEQSTYFVIDPDGDYGTAFDMPSPGLLQFALGSTGAAESFRFNAFPQDTNAIWHHVLCSAHTDAASGQKQVDICISGIHPGIAKTDTDGAFLTALAGKPIYLGDDGQADGATFDIAEFWFAPGQSLLVDGLIPLETIRKFIDAGGKPVYLGEDGSAPTGTPPALFFHAEPGNDVATFPVNRGTGGACDVVGSLTASSTNPSDPFDIGFGNPMTDAGDLIAGGANGIPERLANPGPGTFVLKSIDGVLTWVAA